MSEPIVKFTLEEAQDHYKGNPTVKCLTNGKVMMLNSKTIHSEKYAEHPEPWIWGRNYSGLNILLYGPSKFKSDSVKAEIINID